MRYCYHCMQVIEDDVLNCPFCGTNPRKEVPVHHLMPGTVLNDKFLVGQALGEGGFGITYIGRDLNLDMIIAIKEYYPNGYVNRNNTASPMVTGAADGDMREVFEQGKDRFIKEARILGKFANEPGIVNVRDFFETNNTAYIIMEYLEGKTLKAYLKEKGILSADEVVNLMLPMIRSLKKVHQQGLIHRDIAPDNIMITSDSVKLLDFGAARDVSNGNKSLSVMLKPGFAPEEQYRSRGQQGPWTDIYAICATMYKCITKVTPDDSTQRLFSDEVKRPSELGIAINPAIENAIMKGMSVRQQDRYQNVDELINGLSGQEEASEASDFIPYSQMGANNEEVKITGYNDKKISKNKSDSEQRKIPSKKVIIASIIGVLVIGIGVILAVSLGKSDKHSDTANTVADEGKNDSDKEGMNGADQNSDSNSSDRGDSESNKGTKKQWPDEYYLNFVLDGSEYAMPFDMSELFDNGWVFDGTNVSKDTVIEPYDTKTLVYMVRNGRSIILTVYNPSSVSKVLGECKVCELEVQKDSNAKLEIGGVNIFDMSSEQIVQKFGIPYGYSENNNRVTLEYHGEMLAYPSYIKYSFNKNNEEDNTVTIQNLLYERVLKQTIMDTPVLSDKFYDYTFELDGVTYQLPCTLEQFVSNGWTINKYGVGDDTMVTGKSLVGFTMIKGESEIDLEALNSNGNATSLADCKIVTVEYSLNQPIEFRTVKNATEYNIDTVKSAYADFEPEVYESSSYTKLTYYLPYNQFAGVELWFPNSGASESDKKYYNKVKLTNIDYGKLNSEETVTTVPEYLDAYNAPKAFGQDITKEIVKIDDEYYEIMAPMSEFLKNGWKIVGGMNVLPCGMYTENVTLEKDGKFLWNLKVQNNSWNQCSIENCVVSSVVCDNSNYESAEVVLFGGVTIGTDEAELVAAAGDLLKKDEYSSYTRYSFNKDGVGISVMVNSDKKVYKISVECK